MQNTSVQLCLNACEFKTVDLISHELLYYTYKDLDQILLTTSLFSL